MYSTAQAPPVGQVLHSGNRRPSSSSSTSETSSSEDSNEADSDKPVIDLSDEALNTGLSLEILILEALVNQPEMDLFKVHGGLNQLSFAHPEGDLFTWLNVTRQWVSQLQNGTVENWYQKNQHPRVYFTLR